MNAPISGPGYAERPDYAVVVTPLKGTARASQNGQVIAESANAFELWESKYPPVIYFPAADVRTDLATRQAKSTYCPFKGTATYWRFGDVGDTAWSYETPYDEVAEIAGCLAFYPDKVSVTTD